MTTSLQSGIDAMLTQFAKLDLGEKYEPCCPPVSESPGKRVYYPSIYISDRGVDLSAIPDKGKAVIEYEVKSKTISEANGQKRYSMSMDVKSLEPMKDGSAKKGASASSSSSSAKLLNLDKAGAELQEAMGEVLHCFDMVPRERGADGTFVANETGGLDPTTMRQAYGDPPPKKKRRALAIGAGVAAAGLGAGAGAVAGRVLRRNWGGPGVPVTDSLKAAGAHAMKQGRKALSRWRGVA